MSAHITNSLRVLRDMKNMREMLKERGYREQVHKLSRSYMVKRIKHKSRNKILSNNSAGNHKVNTSHDYSNYYSNFFDEKQSHSEFQNLNEFLSCRCQGDCVVYQNRIKSSRERKRNTKEQKSSFELDFPMYTKMKFRHADELARGGSVKTKNLCKERFQSEF